jgi:hypothetical protein
MKMVRKAVMMTKILMRAMKMAQLQGGVRRRRSEPNTAKSNLGNANSVVWCTIRKPKIMGSVQQNAAMNRETPRRKGNLQAPMR